MAKYFNLAAAALLAAAAATAAPAMAQKIGQAPVGEPAVPQTHSVEQADARLAEVARDRAAVQAEYDAAEQVCNAKFFVNYCLDKAKEKRRVALRLRGAGLGGRPHAGAAPGRARRQGQGAGGQGRGRSAEARRQRGRV